MSSVLERDGFECEPPFYHCFVSEDKSKPPDEPKRLVRGDTFAVADVMTYLLYLLPDGICAFLLHLLYMGGSVCVHGGSIRHTGAEE